MAESLGQGTAAYLRTLHGLLPSLFLLLLFSATQAALLATHGAQSSALRSSLSQLQAAFTLPSFASIAYPPQLTILFNPNLALPAFALADTVVYLILGLNVALLPRRSRPFAVIACAADYTLEVSRLPNSTTAASVHELFNDNPDLPKLQGLVYDVVLSQRIDRLIKLARMRSALFRQLSRIEAQLSIFGDNTRLNNHLSRLRWRKYVLTNSIRNFDPNGMPINCAFVTFKNPHSAALALHSCKRSKLVHPVTRHRLHVHRAAPPDELMWENLHTRSSVRFLLRFITAALTIPSLAIAGLACIYALRRTARSAPIFDCSDSDTGLHQCQQHFPVRDENMSIATSAQDQVTRYVDNLNGKDCIQYLSPLDLRWQSTQVLNESASPQANSTLWQCAALACQFCACAGRQSDFGNLMKPSAVSDGFCDRIDEERNWSLVSAAVRILATILAVLVVSFLVPPLADFHRHHRLSSKGKSIAARVGFDIAVIIALLPLALYTNFPAAANSNFLMQRRYQRMGVEWFAHVGSVMTFASGLLALLIPLAFLASAMSRKLKHAIFCHVSYLPDAKDFGEDAVAGCADCVEIYTAEERQRFHQRKTFDAVSRFGCLQGLCLVLAMSSGMPLIGIAVAVCVIVLLACDKYAIRQLCDDASQLTLPSVAEQFKAFVLLAVCLHFAFGAYLYHLILACEPSGCAGSLTIINDWPRRLCVLAQLGGLLFSITLFVSWLAGYRPALFRFRAANAKPSLVDINPDIVDAYDGMTGVEWSGLSSYAVMHNPRYMYDLAGTPVSGGDKRQGAMKRRSKLPISERTSVGRRSVTSSTGLYGLRRESGIIESSKIPEGEKGNFGQDPGPSDVNHIRADGWREAARDSQQPSEQLSCEARQEGSDVEQDEPRRSRSSSEQQQTWHAPENVYEH
jgi:hypothetical protein